MGNVYLDNQNLMFNTLTGSAKLIENDGEIKTYAVVVKCGHCGKGYFIPILLGIHASSAKAAVEIARNLGRVKKGNKNNILAVCPISDLEYKAITAINDKDLFILSDGSLDIEEHVIERRVIMQETVDDFEKNPHKFKNFSIKDISEVKTSDEYRDYHVLQRYFAPYKSGDRLVFPEKVNLRSLLDEYFYHQTIYYGMIKRHTTVLAYYLQLYGFDNDLGVKYANGMVSFKNKHGVEYTLPVSEMAKEALDKLSIQDFEKKTEQVDEIIKIKQPSRREKFKARLEKSNLYVGLKNSTNNEDESQK